MAIVTDYRAEGEALWERFSAPSAAPQLWYYRALAAIFAERRPGRLAEELGRVVDQLGELVRESGGAFRR
jgi:hypothetical protein